MAQPAPGNVWDEVAGGLRRLLGGGWSHEDRPIGRLLDLLVRGSKLQDDLRAVDLDASPTSTREPGVEEERLERQELEAARADLPDFERALADAWRRSEGTEREVAYDSAEPAQDRAADVLIRYLVTTRTASVRTEEHAEEHYTYYVAVFWDMLFALAAHLDLDASELRGALESAA
jgi:hypothetical protein